MEPQDSRALARLDAGELGERLREDTSGRDDDNDNIPSFASIFSTQASRLAWEQHVAALTDEERKLFLQYTAKYASGDVETLTKDLEASAKTQQQSSRLVKINSFLRPIFRTVNLYMPAVASGLQADPYPASAIVGGIMCIVHMTFKTTILTDFEVEVYRSDERVQDVLVSLYGDVLNFCQKAFRLVKDKGSGRIFRKALKEKFQDTFGPVIKQFETHLDQYADVAKLCESRRLLQFYKFQANEAGRQEAFRKQQTAMMQDFYTARQFVHRSRTLNVMAAKRINEYDGESPAVGTEKIHVEASRQEGEYKRTACINWLQSVEHSEEQSRRMKICADNTCVWLQENEKFQSWKSATSSNLLWIKGKAGSGKSILAAKTLNLLQNQLPQSCIAYFYCSAAETLKSDCTLLLSTILKQLVCSDPGLDEQLERLYDRKSLVERRGPSDDDLIGVIKSVLSKLGDTYLVIDGLDECAEPRSVLKYIKALLQASVSVMRVLIFSRPDHREISAPLNSYPQLQLDLGLNMTDIKTFVSNRLAEDDFPWNTNSKLVDTVTTKLVDAAQNVFLYSELQLRRLEGPLEENEVMKRLEETPKGLDDLYLRALERIANIPDDSIRQLAQSALIWTANVLRPLSRAELQEALSVRPQSFNRQSGTGIQNMSFAGTCADLIYLDETGHYQLVHASLKEYLQSLTFAHVDELRELAHGLQNVNEIIGNVCLEYMLSDQFESISCSTFLESQELLEKNPLLCYSAEHWASHIQASAEPVDGDHKAWKLLDNTELRDLILQISLRDAEDKIVFPFPKGRGLLHVLAFFGLDKFVLLRPNLSLEISMFDGLGLLPIDYAFRRNSEAMVSWIVSNHDSSKLTFEDGHYYALHTSIENGWNAVTEALIRKGADVEERSNNFDSSPLCCAAIEGNTFAVEKLLAANVDINAPQRGGWTPLLLAVAHGYIEIVRQLVGIDHILLDSTNSVGMTPLYIACLNGNLPIVKLVASGNVVNTKSGGDSGWQPIHQAAALNHPDMVRELYRKGADLEKEDNHGYRALQLAVRYNALGAAKALVDLGASFTQNSNDTETVLSLATLTGSLPMVQYVINEDDGAIMTSGRQGRTPLHIAAQTGQTQVVKLLLEKGAHIEELNEFNETSLHEAFYSRNVTTVALLLDHGADATKVGKSGKTTLHYAAFMDMPDIIGRLLDLQVAHDVLDDNSRTPLGMAAEGPDDTFALKLVGQVEALGMKFDMKEQKYYTPLHSASSNGFTALVKALVLYYDPNCQTDTNFTPLWLAVSGGHIDTVQLLLDLNVDVESTDPEQEFTPLFVATNRKERKIQELLLARGASTAAEASDGSTLLHIAAQAGDISLIKMLLEKGHDINKVDEMGRKAFVYAVRSGEFAAVDLFLSNGFNGFRDRDYSGESCLSAARKSGSVDMIQKMLNLGLDPNDTNEWGCEDEHDRESVLEKAVASGQTAIVKALLASGAKAPGNIEIMLVEAIESGHVETVETLLHHGWDLLHLSDDSCRLLNAAVQSRRPEMVKVLLENGADPYSVDFLNNHAFDYATGRPELMKLLRDALKQPMKDFTDVPYQRFDNPRVLGWALEELFINIDIRSHDSPTALKFYLKRLWILAADLEHDEAFEAIGYRYYSHCTLNCDVCSKEMSIKEIFYVCKIDKICMCETCQENYENGSSAEKCLPQGFLVYQNLESQVESMTNILLPAFKREGFQVTMLCLGKFDFLFHWLANKRDDWEDWEWRYGSSYDKVPKPGLEFLKIAVKISQWYSDYGRSSKRPDPAQKAELQKLEADLSKHCEIFGFRRSTSLKECSGHQLIKMDLSSFTDTLEKDKRLEYQYFENDLKSAIRERMRDPKPHVDAALDNSARISKEDELKDWIQKLSPINDRGRSSLIGLRMIQALDPQHFATFVEKRCRLNSWGFLDLELRAEDLQQ